MQNLTNNQIKSQDYKFTFDGSGEDIKRITVRGNSVQVIEALDKVEFDFSNKSHITRGEGFYANVGEYDSVVLRSEAAQTICVTFGTGWGFDAGKSLGNILKVDDDETQAAITALQVSNQADSVNEVTELSNILQQLIDTHNKPNARITQNIADVAINATGVHAVTTANGQFEQIIEIKSLPNFADGSAGYIVLGEAGSVADNSGLKLYANGGATINSATSLSVFVPNLDFTSGDVVIGGLEVI